MDVRGQRILIFGDSLSHHGHDAAPEIWDVDQGSNRVSGQPGDLLASMLLEHGAEAVRVNARVSRSAINFFGRERSQELWSSDAAFRPTLVLIILGTNDIGLNLERDAQAFMQIKAFYESLGAKVYAIGPFTYNNAALNIQAAPVVEMMKRVFGRRFIDGRGLSVQEGRAGDGVHFGAQSAKLTASNMLKAVLSASNGIGTIAALALGAAAVIGGALIFQRWRKRELMGPQPELEDFTTLEGPRYLSFAKMGAGGGIALADHGIYRVVKDGKQFALEYSPKGSDDTIRLGVFKRYAGATSEGQKDHERREGLYGLAVPVRDMTKSEAQDEFYRLLQEGDVNDLAVAEDLALQHDLKLSEITMTDSYEPESGGMHYEGEFLIKPGDVNPTDDEAGRTSVLWQSDREGGSRVDSQGRMWCSNQFTVWVDGARLAWTTLPDERPKHTRSWYMNAHTKSFGTPDQCRKHAAADAWAITKAIKQADEGGGAMHLRTYREAVERALDQDNTQPAELYGLEARSVFETQSWKTAQAKLKSAAGKGKR